MNQTLAALFGHTDKSVRDEARGLTTELYRWLGAGLTPSLADLKPVQVSGRPSLRHFEPIPHTRTPFR